MRTLKIALLFCLAIALSSSRSRAAQFNYITLNDPLGTSTWAQGISGNTIVGYYQDSSGENHGFKLVGGNYIPLDDPLASSTFGTVACGISGNTIVGYYKDSAGHTHGFNYNGSSYVTLDDPQASGGITKASGVSGNTIVGSYLVSGGKYHGFIDNNGTYTTVDNPNATGNSYLNGIDGNVAVGSYQAALFGGSFSYANGPFKDFDVPYNPSTSYAPVADGANGISGSLIVGQVSASIETNSNPPTFVTDQSGYLYDGTSFTLLDDPSSPNQSGYGTFAQGISGTTIVGYYYSDNGNTVHGFEVTVPEPAISLLPVGGALFAVSLRRRWFAIHPGSC